MIRTIIIDDEERGRRTLKTQISKYCPELEIVGEANGVQSGLEIIRHEKPDAVFLDIQMQDGTGFDLLEQIPHVNFAIIFATAYDQYAIQAFKFSATDYLLKPIDPDQLIKAVDKLQSELNSHNLSKKLEALFSNKNNFEKIALPTFDGIILVKIKEIIRCQSESNYTTLFLPKGDKIVVTKTLKDFDEMLTPLGFFRIHQSHLINMSFVNKYIKGDGGSVKMEDGTVLEVARRRKDTFLDLLLKN
ncbi:MAG: LytTR family DNA-binding domain-containing protein [Bacteroidales bacterium]|nr:LytTR family DNA-binding domain-containing protein [Bacteroidales bacterium]MCF8455153.1 LytTR family DNA-binding domain-containing protein [Bacteroidales bacterium]